MPRRSSPLLRTLALTAAVAGACSPEAPQGEGSDLPTTYAPVLDEDAATEPLSVSELEEGLAEVLAYLHRQDPLIHHEAWTEVFWDNAETETCPVLGEHNGQDYWRDDCTTSNGARFNGWTLNFRRGGWSDGEMTVLQYNWLSGHAYIIAPDGDRLESFGDIELLLGQSRDFDHFSGFVFGDFAWDDPSAAGTWLQEPVSGELYFEFRDYHSYQTMAYDGGLTYFSGPVLSAVFDEVTMDDIAGSCALEPAGTVRLRDEAGLWVDVVFGAESDADPACDGCGDATFEGAAHGTVCADWTPFVTWEGWPWDG